MATANNPFDINTNAGAPSITTPAPGTTNLQNAINSSAAPQATGYNASTAGATGYNATNADSYGYDATNMNAQGYDANTANLTNWNVDNNQTVQGQLQGLLASGNPLLTQAKTAALQGMNQRGLLNSSMALGEGYNAMVKNALPIAQQDATTNANAGQFNATQANNMAQFNTGQQNTAAQFSAAQANQAAANNQAAQNAASQFGATAANQASLQNAQAANTADQFTASASNTAALANSQSQNQAAQFSAGAANTASLNYAQQLNAQVAKQMDQALAVATSNADNQTKMALQQLDADTRKDLAATESMYKIQMQASASAQDVFQQSIKNISDIMANPDLDVGPKQAAVDAQKAALQNAMSILSKTSGIAGLKDLITFDTNVGEATT